MIHDDPWGPAWQPETITQTAQDWQMFSCSGPGTPPIPNYLQHPSAAQVDTRNRWRCSVDWRSGWARMCWTWEESWRLRDPSTCLYLASISSIGFLGSLWKLNRLEKIRKKIYVYTCSHINTATHTETVYFTCGLALKIMMPLPVDFKLRSMMILACSENNLKKRGASQISHSKQNYMGLHFCWTLPSIFLNQ